MTADDHKSPIPIRIAVDRLLERRGWKAAVSRHAIVRRWPEIVDSAFGGKVVARHAIAEDVEGSTLLIAVDSSVWMNELAALRQVLLQKINAFMAPGAAPITDVRFRLSARLFRPEQKPESLQPQPLTDEDRKLIESALQPIKDEDLRRRIRSVMEKDLRLKKSKAAR
jgi:predicted nucleic acid-binding Zn ribbon protein